MPGLIKSIVNQQHIIMNPDNQDTIKESELLIETADIFSLKDYALYVQNKISIDEIPMDYKQWLTAENTIN